MKILVSSDCNGNLRTLFNKANQLHAKNKFDCLVLVGNVLGGQACQTMPSLIKQQLTVDLPTFFIDSSPISSSLSSVHPQGNQICTNFNFLGQSGIKKFKQLTIAYLNGKQLPMNQFNNLLNKDVSQISGFFTNITIQRLIKQSQKYQKIDLLVTNQWPAQFTKKQNVKTSHLVSKLVNKIAPRYHFAASGDQFYRMDPYKNSKGHPSHFINVAPIDSEQPSGKYLFAVKIQQQQQLIQNLKPYPFIQTSSVGSSNFITEIQNLLTQQQKLMNAKAMVQKSKQKFEHKNNNQELLIDKNTHILFQNFPEQSDNNEIIQFLQRWGQIATVQIFDPKKHKKTGVVKFKDEQSTKICLSDSGKYSWRNQRIRFQVSKTGGRVRDDQCWFCMGTKVFQQILMVYKGQNLYVSMDKGPIAPDHLQIIPLSHQNDFNKLSLDEQRQIEMVRRSFQKYYDQQNKTLICYSRCANISENINHWVQYIVPHYLPQQTVIEKFKEINNRDRHWFKQLTPKNSHLTQKYHAIITIGKISFIKQLERKDRKDILREIVCIMLQNYPAMNWKEVQRSVDSLSKQKKRLSEMTRIILS